MIHLKNAILRVCVICFLIFMSAGCSTIKDLVNIKDPELNLKNAELSDLSFDKADLLLDIEIKNPNNYSLKLDGFNYDLAINKTPFVNGKQEGGQTIKANGSSMFQVPIELKYKNLYDTFQSLANKNSVDYDILLGFDFNLPLAGKTTFPVKGKGSLPLPKIPKIKFDKFKLDDISFSEADLILKIVVENPNSFDLIMNSFNYDLNVDSKSWAKSFSDEKVKIAENGKSVLTIPVTLDFLTMGRAAYRSITSLEPLEYNLKGVMNLDTSLPIMKNIVLPIERKGKIKISR